MLPKMKRARQREAHEHMALQLAKDRRAILDGRAA